MKFLLMPVYCTLGFLMAFVICSTVGMAINVVIALVKSFARPKNLLLALGYGLAAALGCEVLYWSLRLGGWVGENTGYVGQNAIFVGLIFPGFFCLSIIPRYALIALKQTSGVTVD